MSSKFAPSKSAAPGQKDSTVALGTSAPPKLKLTSASNVDAARAVATEPPASIPSEGEMRLKLETGSEVRIPLDIGARVTCRSTRDNEPRTIRVIERRKIPGGAWSHPQCPVEFVQLPGCARPMPGAAATALASDTAPDSGVKVEDLPLGNAPSSAHLLLQQAMAGPAADWEYYVHYLGFNRRMDEWVQLWQLDLTTVEVDAEAAVGADGGGNRKKKKVVEGHDSDSEHADFDPQQLREHEEFTKVKNVDTIELGKHQMDTWYFSPLPPEMKDCKRLYFCEHSLFFFRTRNEMTRHISKWPIRHPPGSEIYRNSAGTVCMYEVDGKKEKTYCQNLCYLAKLFLDHKTLYYDVDLFLFYILCEIDERGSHIVGYFSKEKASEEGYNLACILTLPAYQRKGYGKFLISFSYELSKIENKIGTPERPLSDLGRVSYHGYWTRELLNILRSHEGTISIKDLSDATMIKPDDIVNTLEMLGVIKYQKGQHVLCASAKEVEKHLKAAGGPGLEVDSSRIIWTPYNAEREYNNASLRS